MDFLLQKADEESLKLPVDVSHWEWDGVGYDIRYWDKSSKETHVEIKTTTSKYPDRTNNEIRASKDPKFDYLIYRLYALDVKAKKCKI